VLLDGHEINGAESANLADLQCGIARLSPDFIPSEACPNRAKISAALS
jgi:hypothetical protein